MNGQDLKNSILQMAMQGKLVEQRSEEGTGEELYQQIQEEKQKLIAEGKLKKEKPLPDIQEEEIPFEIPTSWTWVRLGSISTIQAGGTPSRNENKYWNGNIPWVKIADINDKYVNSSSEYITEEGLKNSSAKFLKRGTLLYTIFATIGTVGILNIDAATNQAIAGLTFYGDISIDYMYHVGISLKGLLVKHARGMAQLNINQKILKSIPIPLPTLNEQNRIVDKLNNILPLVEEYDKLDKERETLDVELPEKLKKSILQYAMQGKLVPQIPSEGTAEELYAQIQEEKQKLIKSGKLKKEKPLPPITKDEIPFQIPPTWKWVYINEIAYGGLGKTLNKNKDTGQLSSYLCSINIDIDGINLDKVKQALFTEAEKENYRLHINDLLICEGGDAGKCAVWKEDCEMFYQNALHRFTFYNEDLSIFYKNVFDLYKRSGYLEKYCKGVTIKHLVYKSLISIPIPLPPFNECKRIVNTLREIFNILYI